VVYRFAGFSLDCDTRQLLEGDREVHLSPKAFDLLLLLIEGRSRALSKTDLQDRLWPSVFVGETNLATLVAEIRRALGESAQDARIVRTVHRFGYRFVAAVDEVDRGRQNSIDSATEMYLATANERYPLAPGTTVIGRARDATIRVDSGGVSRHHARIVVSGDETILEDLGSKNGTFVDGRPVTGPCVLKDASEIRIGPLVLTFRVASASAATETVIADRESPPDTGG
jgi:DNA-binding winged helix-turn-helix (wHTH) protein